MTTDHRILTAVNAVLTIYGTDKQYRLVHNSGHRPWQVKFEDSDGWHVEFEGTFTECLDFIKEYDREPEHPF